MALSDLWPALEQLPWARVIRESAYLFPTLESVHVLAITLVVGTIMIVDLRLLGLASRGRAVRRVTREVLPYTWGFFTLAAVSGALMFISRATVYAHVVPFQLKFVCLLIAGLNMLVFHRVTCRDVDVWNDHPRPPAGARVAGALSLCLWLGVIVFGRWTGFVML